MIVAEVEVCLYIDKTINSYEQNDAIYSLQLLKLNDQMRLKYLIETGISKFVRLLTNSVPVWYFSI